MRYVQPGDAAVAEVTSLLGPPRRSHRARPRYSAARRSCGSSGPTAAQFDGAFFHDVRFDDEAWFARAQFASDAWFGTAQFAGDAWFGDAQFAGVALESQPGLSHGWAISVFPEPVKSPASQARAPDPCPMSADPK